MAEMPFSTDQNPALLHALSQAKKSGKQSTHPESSSFTVVKRNGSLVPFRRERIFKALEAAFRDTKKIASGEPTPADLVLILQEVTDAVIKELLTVASKGTSLTVEGIQDMVEVMLMKMDHHDVARDYIIYRDQHKSLRDDSPQNLKISRKDGSFVRFNPMKIASTVEEAFRFSRKVEGPSPEDLVQSVNFLTQKIVARAVALSKTGHVLSVEGIQDEIEQQLMREGFFGVAKDFILYRASLGEQSSHALEERREEEERQRQFITVNQNGQKTFITEGQLYHRFKFACRGLEETVSADHLLEEAVKNFYEEMKESEVDLACMMAARTKIEMEPAYSKVAARLLLDVLYRETMHISSESPLLASSHREYFKQYLHRAVKLERIHPSLLEFDLDKLATAMQLQRDDQFSYLGLQTLYDRYFIHHQEQRLETPQIFWMRVAMGLALNEKEQKTARAIEFYNILSTFLFTSSTPTLFNSGTLHSQLSSCYLSTVMDDLSHIFKVISDDAQLSKWAGGLGNDWSNVRATGATIKGTNGKSQGVIPFLKVANDTAVAVNQCFAPDTRLFTAEGVKTIADVTVGDLVLGISGKYRQVTDKYVYNQKDPMVYIHTAHSLEPIHVTTAHPFYVTRHDKTSAEWVEASQLQAGDYIAQVIPQETIAISELTEDDARFYGILLGKGHLSTDGSLWSLEGLSKEASYLEFVRTYLQERNFLFQEIVEKDSQVQIQWTLGQQNLQDATSGCYVSSTEPTLPFDSTDLYDKDKKKQIHPRLSHLPKRQSAALLQGLVETCSTSQKEEILFTCNSLPLVEGVRYQCLRFGVPTTGKLNTATQSYDLHIPAFSELAQRVGMQPLSQDRWFTQNGFVWSQVASVENADVTMAVCDLVVEDDESYMTTAGLAHNGGKRKGAMCAYLETWHLDIEDFLELRKNTGDERRRTHDMNTANWIPDLFMKRVSENGHWTLFSPNDVPDLHDLYGTAFEKRYLEYEKMVDDGKLKLYKRVEALQLWRKMLSMLFETGHPWITFKDPSNIRSPQDHMGVVHSSNLCTEILLNTSISETAVCNLGSINLPMHIGPQGLDEKKLSATIRTAVRMLDNVIDINFYPIDEARNANLQHRPIGLGIMGFQDALYEQGISYASHEAVEFADTSMEMVSYYAILASSELAKERGAYPSYKGSKWDRGLLPIDTLDLLAKERAGYLDVDRSMTLDWNVVRQHIQKFGMRNSNTMAIAPTATISNITGVSQSIEPMYKHLFVKSNLSGEFTVPNAYLVEKLKQLGIWDEQMLDDLKYFDGSIAEIERIPSDVKQTFLTAFEIDPEWLIECASRRQKWIDMGQSLNLYLFEPSGKKLHQMYFFAWTKGLKTTYYLRSLAATQIEKSTTDINKRGLQPRWMKNKSASSNVSVERQPVDKPKSCSLEEGCESCQ